MLRATNELDPVADRQIWMVRRETLEVEPEPDYDYLRRVEALTNRVCDAASDEGWLTHLGLEEPDGATPLQQAVNEFARSLRHVHHEGDSRIS